MLQPPLRQSGNPSTPEINNPTTKNIPQNEPSHSRGGKYNLRSSVNAKYSEVYRYRCAQNFIPAPFVCHFHSLLSLFHLFEHASFTFSLLGASINKKITSTKTNRIATFKIKQIAKYHCYHQDEKNGVLKQKFLQQPP